MHGKKNNGSPSEVGEVIFGIDKSISSADEGNPIDLRCAISRFYISRAFD